MSPDNKKLSLFGQHRVLNPKIALPQAAIKLNNSPRILHKHELLIDVDYLMLDSTSMTQLRTACKNNTKHMARSIIEIIEKRGKMHNPVTNSGGVLVGRISRIGKDFFNTHQPIAQASRIGDTIIPVASLSTLPLKLRSVDKINGDCVHVTGTAIMFSCMRIAPIPEDFTPNLALACVDISSLVPQVKRCFREQFEKKRSNPTILILGCGKAGLAAIYCIRQFEKELGCQVKIIAVDSDQKKVRMVHKLNIVDKVFRGDARNAANLYSNIFKFSGGELCDLVINVVNIPNTETSTVLCTRESNPRGIVLWFSMATQFDKAALATDSLGKDVTMVIGNGVADQQVEETYGLVRAYPQLRDYFEQQH